MSPQEGFTAMGFEEPSPNFLPVSSVSQPWLRKGQVRYTGRMRREETARKAMGRVRHAGLELLDRRALSTDSHSFLVMTVVGQAP
jgi:hypothetical protein